MIKGYSYIRMSTDIQLKGDSLRRQMDMSKQYCDDNNIELVESIQDIGISGFRGKNATEGALGDFLQLVENGRIEKGSYLIIESLDRLSRDKVLSSFGIFSSILGKGITILTLQDNQVYTSENVNDNPGQLFLSLGVMLRSHDESRMKSSRISSVWKHKRDNYNGKILTSRCPAWMKPKKNKNGFELIKQHADTVQKIYRWSINGDGSLVITRRLNNTNTPSMGSSKQWNKSYITKILSNRSVLGEYQPHIINNGSREPIGDPIKDYYPRVVSDVDFIKVQNGMHKRINQGGRKGKRFSNIFTGVVYCSNCGSKLNYFDKGKKARPSLWCSNSHQHKGCKSKPWNYQHIEDVLLSSLSELNLRDIFDSDAALQNEDLKNQIILLEDDIKHSKQQLDKNTNSWLDSDPEIQKIIEPKIKQISFDIETDQKKLNKLKKEYENITLAELEKSKNQLSDFKSVMASTTNDADLYQLRSLVSHSVKSIVSKIYVDTSMTVNPWEYDDLDVNFLKILKKKRYTNREKIENYINTDQGQRTFVEFERTIKIIFKGGKIGWIKPSRDANIRLNKIDF